MIAGKRVVVTGKIAGHSRQTAEAALHDAGAILQSAVNGDTDLLVIGAKVGASKMNKARELGVDVVTWEQAFAAPNGKVRVVDIETRLAEGRAQVAALAKSVAPMLAKKGELPTGPDWLFEVKWDGYRCVATVKDGQVSMQSRSGKSEYLEQFPHIAKELASLPDCVIDGELCVLDGAGNTSFESMDAKAGASFVVFDVLELMGVDIRHLTLTERRAYLEQMLGDGGLGWISCSPVFDDGDALLAWAAEQKVEGIVAKRRSSPYCEGTRTDAWRKIKLRSEQEFAVLGWIPGEGSMAGAAGSLVLALYDEEAADFVCCGRVGTGREYAVWEAFTHLPGAEDHSLTFDLNGYVPPKSVVWIDPIVVQVRFQRWTEDGRLWHPSLLGVREDKSPIECRRES